MPYFSHKVHQAYSASGIKCGNRSNLFELPSFLTSVVRTSVVQPKFSIKEGTTLGSQIMVIILHFYRQLCETGVHSDKKFGHI